MIRFPIIKIGDLIRIRSHEKCLSGKMGVILDAMDLPTGYSMYEVLIENEAHWVDDIDIETVNESR
jgi:hypothetical protein